ncbi:MAG TPA: (Fe-S)-binding protein [Negativicutes bacterium]|nr:(Fe-S)-binding protein [Negativicutes bacterium]
MHIVLFLFIALVSVGYLFYAVVRRYRLTQKGRPEMCGDQPAKRWQYFLHNIILQKKVRDYPFFALCHFFIIAGFLILLPGIPNMAAEGLWHTYIPYIGNNPLYLLVKDLADIMLILGVAGLLLRRLINKPAWLKNNAAAFGKLGLILLIVLSEAGYHAARFAVGEDQTLRQAAPLAFAGARLFAGLAPQTVFISMTVLWWTHFLGIFAFCFFIPHSSHLHLVFAPFNAYWHTLAPKGALPKATGDGRQFRLDGVADFTWKQLFDAYSCVKCGRCNGQCPGQLSGEEIKPKALTARLRKHVDKNAAKLLSNELAATKAETRKAPDEKKTAGKGKTKNKLVGEVYEQDFIWNCTTCGACMEACPVATEHLPKMIALRRHLVLAEGRVSKELQRVFTGIAGQGNPWGRPQQASPGWVRELSVPDLEENPQAEYLYYPGCAALFAERAPQTAAAFGKILQAAGVNFAIPGKETRCCGHMPRRLGQEPLFEEAVKDNITAWRKQGVKKIITTCAHCYNTLRNEYPQYGGAFTVIHHADFIAGLLRAGKLTVRKSFPRTVTLHDPCYLGRYNDLVTAPRAVLRAVPALELKEMPRRGERTFCCGAGGGRFWTKPRADNLITGRRLQEAQSTGAEVIATACPYCELVFAEELKSGDASLEVLDIAEIVAESI